jgi:TRAP-type C4-dicarboxylate transport system permease small subunit
MSALYDTLSGLSRKIFYVFSLILSACLSGFLLIMSLQVTRTIYDMKGEIPSMGIPKYLPYLAVTVALLFMALHFVQLTVCFFKTGETDDVLEGEE